MRGMGLAGMLQASPKFEVAVVCDIDAARAKAAAEKLGADGVQSHAEALARDDVQALVVATDARWHAPVVFDALAAKRHVYVEKPLADSPQTAARLADAQEAAGVVGVVGYQFRATPMADILERELAAIQPVQGLLTVQRGPMNPQYFFPDHYGGVVDTATHTIHSALWTMGGQPTSVSASLQRGSILGDRTIEFMSLLIEFDGGKRVCTITGSMFGVRTANIWEFVGTRGVAHTTNHRVLHLTTHAGIHTAGNKAPDGLETREIDCPAEGDSTRILLERFADLVSGTADRKHPKAASFREGAEAVAVTAAMVRSAEEGRRVNLAEVMQG